MGITALIDKGRWCDQAEFIILGEENPMSIEAIWTRYGMGLLASPPPPHQNMATAVPPFPMNNPAPRQ